MKNKLFITFLILLVALCSVNASTIDEILESAKKNSPSYQNYLLTYQNGLLDIAQLEEEDKIGVSINASASPLMQANTDNVALNLNLTSVKVTLPDEGNTTITGNASITTKYKTGETEISGGLEVAHTFDFSGYKKDTAEDLSYKSTKYGTELTRKENELTFEKNVLSIISSILSAESSLKQSEFSVEKQQTALDKLVALKTYTEESSVYMNTLNMLNSLKSSLEASKEQYNQLLSQYKTLTGLDWDGVDGLVAPVLSLTTYENGNTNVLLQSLNVQSSEDAYNKAVASANSSSLSTSFSVGYMSKAFSLSGSATYNNSASGWDVTVSPSFTISTSGDVTPSVTISGSWKNDTSFSDSSINKALNAAKTATNNYLETLSSYQENAASYALRILQWNTKLAQAESDMQYKKTLLDNTQALYDLGLETQESLKSAELNYAASQTDYSLVIIDGLSLERDLEIFAL